MTDHPERPAHPDHPDRVELDQHIDAPPHEVFEYVTDLARRPFGDDGYLELGDELLRDEPSRIAWHVTIPDGDRRHPGTVEVAITPDGSGSWVRVTHVIGSPIATLGRAPAATLTRPPELALAA